MKKAIHPKWYPETQVSCACGNRFTVGSTVPEIRVEVCSNCHPFYTGQMRYLDTAGRVDKFRARLEATRDSKVISKKVKRQFKAAKRLEEERARPTTLGDVRGR
ncbi:MAG: 50S ribosomal protein L31 [Candidatus Blackburnbacteria bacterium]|nr:50S ribosomal protein L31 [Candidatus Blackburnbacteria bacterium]